MTVMDELKPVCRDCLSGDVAVKLIDQWDFAYYFCGPCDAANRELGERLIALLAGAADELEVPANG